MAMGDSITAGMSAKDTSIINLKEYHIHITRTSSHSCSVRIVTLKDIEGSAIALAVMRVL